MHLLRWPRLFVVVPVRPFFFFHTRSFVASSQRIAGFDSNSVCLVVNSACAAVPRTPEIVRNKQHNTTGGAVFSSAFVVSVHYCKPVCAVGVPRSRRPAFITIIQVSAFNQPGHKQANRRPSNTTAATASLQHRAKTDSQQTNKQTNRTYLSAMDLWVPTTMKNAAKCDT